MDSGETMMRSNLFSKICLGFFLILMIVGQVFIAVAQLDSEASYEVIAEVPVVKNNFAAARKKAVKIALRSALEQDLRETLGDDEFERNRREVQKMLKVSKKYVRSYRFLEAYDDPLQLTSRIKLEVNFFQDAISKSLSRRGVALGLEGVKQAVILINENSLSSDVEPQFWETVPISEMLLTRNFIEAGIPVVSRDSIRYEISKKTVMSALKGDVSAAVNIGSKVGADIVIIGNAASTSVIDGENTELRSVRVGINIKVFSSHQSTIIAAKSDFATASENEVFASELKAFHRAGKKMTGFLIPAIQKYWKSGSGKQRVRQPTPVPQTNTSPLPFGDL